MSTDAFSFLALGDSYTIGESVDSVQRWPVQLANTLTEDGVFLEEPVIVARTGWTTDELAAGIADAGLSGPYDLVSLLIGVNNQYRGRDLEEYRAQYAALLEQAITFAGSDPKRVLVLSIPDWGVTPFAEGRDRGQIGREIDAFNRVKLEETERAGASYVDVTEISREAAENSTLIAPDGLHPSGEMYARWVEAAQATAMGILHASDGS
jgi:lysophospholipase L1-like esterase